MKAVCLQNLTFEPKEVADLKVADNQVQPGRVSYSLNEGDIRSIVKLKELACEIHAISFGNIDATSLVHTFVRGASEIYQIGESFSHEVSDKALCSVISKQIQDIGDIQLFSCGGVEQDSGRSVIAAGVAAKLGWEFISNVLEIKIVDGMAAIKQEIGEGTQDIKVNLPLCFTMHETCGLGDDPSDEFDLMEQLEKKESIKIKMESLNAEVNEKIKSVELSEPVEKQAQDKIILDESAISQVIELVNKYAN